MSGNFKSNGGTVVAAVAVPLALLAAYSLTVSSPPTLIASDSTWSAACLLVFVK